MDEVLGLGESRWRTDEADRDAAEEFRDQLLEWQQAGRWTRDSAALSF